MKLRQLRLKPRDGMMLAIGVVAALVIGGVATLVMNHKTAVAYQDKGITAKWIPSTVSHWQSDINKYAKQYNVDPNLIAIIITMESGGDAKAKSEAGAIGLMQVTPPTAQDIASKYLDTPVSNYDLTNPQTNIEFGTAYLAYLRNYFQTNSQAPSWDNTVELIAAGYNGGPGAAGRLDAGKGLTDTQTVVYSRDAFNMWRERVSATSPTFDRWKERGGNDLITAAQASQQ